MSSIDDVGSQVASRWGWALGAAIIVLAVLGALSVGQYRTFTSASAELDRAEQTSRAIDTLVLALVDGETGYRGYLLSDNPVFLAPYRDVDTRSHAALVRLTGLIGSDPTRRDDLTSLSSLVDRRLREMAENLARHDEGNQAAAVAGVRSGVGKALMDQIRQIAARLKGEEQAVASERARQAAGAASAARGFGIATAVVAMLLTVVAWSLSRSMEQRRRELADAAIARLEAERDAAESAAVLQQSENFTRGILDSSADGICVLSPGGDIVLVNRAGQQQFALAADSDWRHQPFAALWPAHAREAAAALRAAGSGGEGRFVASREAAHGLQWWDVIVTAVRDAAGGVNRVVATARDITAQKYADEERLELLASERAARSEAERAARLKDDFVSTLSHELRTPLNAILGWVGVLRQDQSIATLTKAVDVIDRNSRRQSQMIDDLLDMGRILAGKLRLDVQRVELASVIEEAILSAQPSADAKGVRVLTTLGSAAIIRGDSGRLQQVVWNLLSNAIKFTPRGGQVQVTLSKVNSHVHLQVSDTGAGIAPALVPHVFERFRQADSSTSRRHGGLGLGLSIVKNLVEMHGGSVDVSSEGEGAGATFTVRLPLALSARADTDASTLAPAAAVVTVLRGVHVLVLDDEEDARDVVKRLLEDAGAAVTAAGSAAEAHRALVTGLVPDVIVSDVGMPEQDGYEFIQTVRRMPRPLDTVPAAALTALARLEDRKRAMLSGFQTHLAKPVDPAELVATVASLAGRTGRS